jgi:hypothetical protein
MEERLSRVMNENLSVKAHAEAEGAERSISSDSLRLGVSA